MAIRNSIPVHRRPPLRVRTVGDKSTNSMHAKHSRLILVSIQIGAILAVACAGSGAYHLAPHNASTLSLHSRALPPDAVSYQNALRTGDDEQLTRACPIYCILYCDSILSRPTYSIPVKSQPVHAHIQIQTQNLSLLRLKRHAVHRSLPSCRTHPQHVFSPKTRHWSGAAETVLWGRVLQRFRQSHKDTKPIAAAPRCGQVVTSEVRTSC